MSALKIIGMDRMKILQLTEHYLPFFGGVEKHIHEISKRLVENGVDVEVVCEREKNTPNYEIMDGVKIHRVSGFRLIKLKYDIGRIAPGMIPSAIINDADIIHAHAYSYFPTWASMFSKFSGKPVVITTHSDPAARIYPFWDLCRSIPIRICDHVVATTLMEKQHLILRGVKAENITVIPNGITLPPSEAPISDFPNTPNTILCLARLDIDHKGQDILLKAMPKVLSKIPNAKLWIAGKGNDLVRLQDIAKKLNIGGNITFVGPIDEYAKALCLKNCSLLCVAPRTESFGIIYLEAMSYGLPIVTTSVGGISEVVDDAALLVPPDNPSSLADAIIRVLTDKALADELSKKGLERVKQFDWDAIVKKYEELYMRMVS